MTPTEALAEELCYLDYPGRRENMRWELNPLRSIYRRKAAEMIARLKARGYDVTALHVPHWAIDWPDSEEKA